MSLLNQTVGNDWVLFIVTAINRSANTSPGNIKKICHFQLTLGFFALYFVPSILVLATRYALETKYVLQSAVIHDLVTG